MFLRFVFFFAVLCFGVNYKGFDFSSTSSFFRSRMSSMRKIFIVFSALAVLGCLGQNEISEFENPTDCGNKASDWKPCIERKIGDQVFAACCERFVPPECRGLCIYETHPIEARVVVSFFSFTELLEIHLLIFLIGFFPVSILGFT